MNEKNEHILIISGGTINLEWAKLWLKKEHFDYVIAADKGLMYADKLNCRVDYILGDYDSVQPEILEKYRKENVELITFPCEKDYTDTHLAIKTAIEKGAKKISIIGATGTRLDHTMANIQNMLMALRSGIFCYIINENNKIYVSDKKVIIKKKEQYGKYISLIPMTDKVLGVTLTGFHYPLDKYTLEQGFSVGISNEIQSEEAMIELEEGILIIYETND